MARFVVNIFEEVGGFDQGYRRPCIEDIELGYRLKYAGYPIHLRSDIQVKHLKRWTPISLLRADIFYRALPWMDLLMQVQRTRPAFYQRFTQELNLQWSSRVSVILVFGLLLSVIGAGGSAIAASVSPMVWGLGIGQSLGWITALLCGLALGLINLPVYRFFYQRHGWLFALKTVPWHWLYFLLQRFGICLYRRSLSVAPWMRCAERVAFLSDDFSRFKHFNSSLTFTHRKIRGFYIYGFSYCSNWGRSSQVWSLLTI